VARLDDARVRAQLEQADAAVRRATASLARTRVAIEEAKDSVALAAARVSAAEVSLALLRKEVPRDVAAADAAVVGARAAVAKAEATREQADRDVERTRRLVDQGTLQQREMEMAETAVAVAVEDVAAAKAALTGAEEALAQARLGGDRIRVKEEEIATLRAEEARARTGALWHEAAVAEGEASVAAAEGARKEIQSVLDDLTVVSPTDGVVLTRMVEEGEVVARGAALLEVVDLGRLYLKVYVPEPQIGRIRIGSEARIFTDAYPDTPVDATVRYVASQAEFTPKEVQTPDERVKLVFAVKLYLKENPEHRFTPGLPADAVIRWKDGTPWARPRW
ncbi:MAG TPA: HlyD family efflux transporter periplasmic adaptor subunit, partial [Planctomycetota bacterium]|nr:HlyD family efflux transporter periplasmic adaptor subunit [Planctomycetota bacterium]